MKTIDKSWSVIECCIDGEGKVTRKPKEKGLSESRAWAMADALNETQDNSDPNNPMTTFVVQRV